MELNPRFLSFKGKLSYDSVYYVVQFKTSFNILTKFYIFSIVLAYQ